MHSLGNHFMVIDGVTRSFEADPERYLRPLGMRSTGFEPPPGEPTARGHARRDGWLHDLARLIHPVAAREHAYRARLLRDRDLLALAITG